MIKNFGQKLKSLRKQAKLTQREVASELNFSQRCLAGYETNTREVNFHNLVVIADFYDVSVDWLLGRTDKKEFTEAEQ